MEFNIALVNSITVNELVKKIGAKSEHGPERAGDIKHSLASVEATKALGDYSKYTFEEGLKETVEFYKC